MQPNLLKYLDRRIPRYTSYPTAVQFCSDVNAQSYEDWLATLPADAPVSIYIHVPFCAELCLFCGCHTTVARRYAPIAAYADLLEREINLVGRITGRHKVFHVHWGGGSPTMLASDDFMRVTAALWANFTPGPATDTAIEIDPRSLSPDYVPTLRDAGITRASFGVQDFEERVQRAIGRQQSFEQTARAVDWLRGLGTASINLDLMYGLPYQSVATIAATTRKALTLRPDRIALFGYAHVPWVKRHQKLIPEDVLPGSDERFTQSRTAAELLAGAGYQPIGLDHFARRGDLLAQRQREGRLHRNFQGYTTDDASVLIASGSSAIGVLPQGYVQNATSIVTYRDMIAAGKLATVRGRALTDEDRLRGSIIERLMCDLQVDVSEICAAHDADANHFAAEFSKLVALENDGIVERSHSKITIPEYARPFVRTVCAVFDAYLSNDETRFSRAS
jgi:oxygen-independent coproporphyrinogen-3 oxidase